MKRLTIFTPTHNRAYILPKLYESLCVQTCQDFEWLIVDDGSTDNTKELVDEWIGEGGVMRYNMISENGILICIFAYLFFDLKMQSDKSITYL